MPKTNIQKDLRGLQLVSRYSLPPNSLGYCGRGSAPEKFKRCIKTGICKDIPIEVEKFIVLHPYLNTIAKVLGASKTSHKVVEAYWLGNDHLKKFKKEHYDILLDNFLEQGVPDFFVKELRTKKPKKFIPTHLFQVLHIGVGKSSGAVPFNMDSINNCMIRWGKVKNKDKNKGKHYATVELNSLKRNSGKYELTKRTERIEYDPDITGMINIGNIVTVHWKIVTKVLTEKETNSIKKWSKKTLEIINI